jgi:hypothetical protein
MSALGDLSQLIKHPEAFMRAKANKNFPAIHVASERSSETRYHKVKELFDRLNEPNRFVKGKFVKWKAGLRNKAFPDYGEAAIVMAVLAEAIFDPSENSAASPYFREPLTIVIGTYADDDLVEFYVDGRRFETLQRL